MTTGIAGDVSREKALMDYRKKLLEHKEIESRLKESEYNLPGFGKSFVTNIQIGDKITWKFLYRRVTGTCFELTWTHIWILCFQSARS